MIFPIFDVLKKSGERITINTKRVKDNLYKTLNIMSGALILMIISLYNGFPLVYADTGAYLYSGFDIYIPQGRPVIYGLFMNLFSLHISLWFVVLIQNIITAFVIFEVCRLLISREKLTFLYHLILLFLTAFTGIGWYTNQLIPDFFAPIFMMIIFLILYEPGIKKWKFIFYSLIFIISLMSHFSHLLISVVILVIVVAVELIFPWHKIVSGMRFKLSRVIILSALIAASWILLPSINYLIEKKFIVSKGSHVFLMAHMVDTGLLKMFLKENCNTPEYKDCKLCQYRDSIPNDLGSFLWDPKGIFKKTGGWTDSEQEYNKIIYGMLKDPKYLALNIFKSFTYGCTQLFKFNIGQGLDAYVEKTGTYDQVKWRFPDELNVYLNSRQNKWNASDLNLKTLNVFNLIVNILCGFLLLYIFLTDRWKQIKIPSVKFLLFVLLAIIINAFVVASINSPSSRFQARVTWLLPMALIIIFSTYFTSEKKVSDT